MIPIFMTFRGERWKILGQWYGFWPWIPLHSKLLSTSYRTNSSWRKEVNEKMLYFDDLSEGLW